jgi:hypothetical protein
MQKRRRRRRRCRDKVDYNVYRYNTRLQDNLDNAYVISLAFPLFWVLVLASLAHVEATPILLVSPIEDRWIRSRECFPFSYRYKSAATSLIEN